MNKCYKNENNGKCCCTCFHQKKLMCHPSNGNNKSYGFLEDKIKFGQGSINQQCGWICDGQFEDGSNDREVEFHDFEHGLCELYRKK